jgi:tungstate transport system substrate-binding protein
MQSTDDKTHRKCIQGSDARRRWLKTAACAVAATVGMPVHARGREVPLRLAVDLDIHDSGVVLAWLRGFGRDTGLSVDLQPDAAAAAVDRAVAGDADLLLSATPALEAPGLAQGLLHDRRELARLDWRIAGPVPAAGNPIRPPGVAMTPDAVSTLQAAAAAAPARPFAWLQGESGAAGDWLLDDLLEAAGIAPSDVRRERATTGDRVSEAQARGLWVLIGGWARLPRSPSPGGRPPPAWGLQVEQDPRLRSPVALLRPLRAVHPAARLFADWVSGPRGRRLLHNRPGVLPPAA